MVDYKNGKIYKIVCNTTGLVYIGSTCETTLAHRLAKHKSSYNSYINGKQDFITAYKILEYGSYEIVLLELYPCNTKDELHARERFHIENINDCVNKVIPTRTHIEWVKNNKNHVNEYQRQYYEQNKDILKMKVNKYYEKNSDLIKLKRRKYREEHKNETNERKRFLRHLVKIEQNEINLSIENI